jgi:hypothetical protein
MEVSFRNNITIVCRAVAQTGEVKASMTQTGQDVVPLLDF